MGWFNKKKKKPEVDLAATFYGDKKPSLEKQLAELLKEPRFVGLERASTNTYKITIRIWNGTSRRNVSYCESLERVLYWAGGSLERDKNGIG